MKKKKKLSNMKLFIVLLVEIALLFGMGYYYLDSKYKKLNHIEVEDYKINKGANKDQENYRLIAIFGIDARSNESMGAGNRSDSIMIASVNKKTNEVKVVSVYRDSFLNVNVCFCDDCENSRNPDKECTCKSADCAYKEGITTKVTHAYAYGGPVLALQTLNKNLDLEITDFVTVNFMALTKAIDLLGGVTVGVEENELATLNTSIAEQVNVTGIYSDGVFKTGQLKLNGTQATAYSRIRSTDMGDITRTERQREVLAAMMTELKASNLAVVDDIVDEVFPYMLTSISEKELVSLAKGILKYNLSETAGFPLSYTPVSHPSKGDILVPDTLVENVKELHKYLFNTENYTPTQTVQDISNKISEETGVY